MSLSNPEGLSLSMAVTEKMLAALEPTEKKVQEGPIYCDVAPQSSQAFLKSFPEVNSLQSLLPLRAMKTPFVSQRRRPAIIFKPIYCLFSSTWSGFLSTQIFRVLIFPVPLEGTRRPELPLMQRTACL